MPTAKEEEIGHKGFDVGLIARLLGYLRPYQGWVVLTFLLIFVASTVRQAGPYITKIAVDKHILPGIVEGFGALVMIYIGLLVVQFVIGYWQSWITNMIGQWAMRDIRMEIFSRLQRLPLQFFDRTPLGRLMALNTSDVDALNELFTDGLVSVLSDILTIGAILAFIFYMDVRMGLLTSLALPIAGAATFWLQHKTFFAYRVARVRFARFAASLQETISGIEVVHLFSFEDKSVGRFQEANNSYLEARMESTFYHSLYYPFMEFAGIVLLAIVLWYGGLQVLDAEIEWGILVAMLQYVPRLFMPIRNIADRYMTIQVAMASSERIFELLDTPAEPAEGTHRSARIRGEIEFRNVWFTYNEKEDWVLRDVSFRVEPGESIALVGATGSGKSTIINLVCGFYPIQKGSVLVDGIDIREWNSEELRRRVGVVQQDVFLFSGDISENISLGKETISKEQVEQAARNVNADRFIERLPNRYAHDVREQGSSLSVGQRQLLSFARELAADPDVLVLDEATASVDTETEVWIQEAVERLMKDRTSIVIAHRVSTIQHADKILVLHHGRVREKGSHAELLERKGIYFRLHQLQYAESG